MKQVFVRMKSLFIFWEALIWAEMAKAVRVSRTTSGKCSQVMEVQSINNIAAGCTVYDCRLDVAAALQYISSREEQTPYVVVHC